MGQNLKFVKNAAGRNVPTVVNGMKAVPYKGVKKYTPKGLKAATPIYSCQDYPSSGNKVVGTHTLTQANITDLKVDVTTETDASIVGGLKLRVGNTLIDGSIYSRLQKMRETLIEV